MVALDDAGPVAIDFFRETLEVTEFFKEASGDDEDSFLCDERHGKSFLCDAKMNANGVDIRRLILLIFARWTSGTGDTP